MAANIYPDNLYDATASVTITVTYTAAAAAANGGASGTYQLNNVQQTPEFKQICDDLDALQRAGSVVPT